ncbi:MAG: alpha-glucosidase C-terminal domain-containing protein, partial [Gemmatimonadota bacterium]
LALFAEGSVRWLVTDDTRNLLAYERALGDQRAIVVFNNADRRQTLAVAAEGRYRAAYPAGDAVSASGGKLTADLPPRSARVWLRE